MIVDTIQRADSYASLHPDFGRAFEFLRRPDLGRLSPGRNDIDGSRLYAMVIKDKGRPREEAKLEAHRRYIDIQFVVSGVDEMGWKPLAACGKVSMAYNREQDAALFDDRPDSWIAVGPGALAIFYPDDAHAPMAGAGPIHKVVVKVAVAAG